MDKQPLPGWGFMIAGLLFMGYTRFIQYKAPTSKIGVFFYLGILLLLFGIYREFVPRLKSKPPKPTPVGPPPSREQHHPDQVHHSHPTQHATHVHTKPQQHPSHPYQPPHKQCPRCHQLNHTQTRYCHNCGFQFY